MNTDSHKFKIKLGMFVTIGILLFIAIIFVIGNQKNLFSPVLNLSTTFHNVSGLQVGNRVRFSGINVGTVEHIEIVNDSSVKIDMLIKKNYGKFIRSDSKASIGSEGIIGDKLVIISQGSSNAALVNNRQYILSDEPVEMNTLINSLFVTTQNLQIISEQAAEIMIKINRGNGTLGRLIQDTAIAENLSQTIVNLKKGSKGLNENMNAAKENFLLKGYFKKKEKEAARKKEEGLKQKSQKDSK